MLIDSFLRGLPVPQIFLYIDDEKKYSVIDGQQRISTIVDFIDGLFGEEDTKGKRKVFRLEGLGAASPYEGKEFDDLDEKLKREFDGRVLRAINIRQLSPDDNNSSMFHIFERLNTGGTALKPQEIRNCVYRGEFVTILRELNEDENWRKIIGTTKLNKHQRDIEFILRIFSLSMIPSDEYEKPMKEYLNKIMGAERTGDSDTVLSFNDIFPAITKFIIEQIGEKPFHVRGPLNTSVMDAVFNVLINRWGKIPDWTSLSFVDSYPLPNEAISKSCGLSCPR